MKDGNIEILDLDFEYKLWKNKLQFYQIELEQLTSRVEVLKKEHSIFKFEIKHFKNIVKQKESIELVRNKIITMEFEMAHYAVDYPISSKHLHYIEHEKIRLEIERINSNQQDILKNIYPLLCFPLNLK